MKQISTRPNRYEECIVREGDLAIAREDLVGFPEIPRVPVRAVLNNKTFILYDNDNYDSTTYAFSLREIRMYDWPKDDKLCFVVMNVSNTKKVTLCVIESGCKGDPKEAKEQWKEDITHFATECQTPYKPSSTQSHAKNKHEAKEECDKEENVAEKVEVSKTEKSNKMLDETVHETAKLAADAVDKELKAEELDEKEEKLREEEILGDMEKKFIEEKTKEECISKAIKRKSQAQQRKAHALEVAAKINDIKQNTVEEIELQQENHKKKMDKEKQIFERKRLVKQREIAAIKMEMTRNMLRAEQKGDQNNCKKDASQFERED